MIATANNIIKVTPTENYTTLSNSTAQIRFKGDKLPSAKEVYIYLYSLPATWEISVKNVSKHFQTSKKYMQSLFNIMIKNDVMIALKMRKNTGKFDGILYKIIAPQVVSRPPVKKRPKKPKLKEIPEKPPQVVSRPPDTYYIEKKQTKENTTTVVVPLFDPKIESKLKEHPDIKRQWIADSLKFPKQTVENILLAIDESKTANKPIGFIRNALKYHWEFDPPKENKNIEKHVQESLNAQSEFKPIKSKDDEKINQQADKLDKIIDNLNSEEKEKAYRYLLVMSPMKIRMKLRKMNVDDALKLYSVRVKLQKYFGLEFE